MTTFLTQANAYVFRIMHRENLSVVLERGLVARNTPSSDPAYVNIGNVDLIEKRGSRLVPIAPHGVLNDYVPFYFTPLSPMAFNIKTGYNVNQRPNDDVLILVSSFTRLVSAGLQVIFTDRHAYLAAARYFSDQACLDQIDWAILQTRDFRRDPNNPEKMDRYQAEALIHRQVPLTAVRGIVVHSDRVRDAVQSDVDRAGMTLKVAVRSGWYF